MSFISYSQFNVDRFLDNLHFQRNETAVDEIKTFIEQRWTRVFTGIFSYISNDAKQFRTKLRVSAKNLRNAIFATPNQTPQSLQKADVVYRRILELTNTSINPCIRTQMEFATKAWAMGWIGEAEQAEKFVTAFELFLYSIPEIVEEVPLYRQDITKSVEQINFSSTLTHTLIGKLKQVMLDANFGEIEYIFILTKCHKAKPLFVWNLAVESNRMDVVNLVMKYQPYKFKLDGDIEHRDPICKAVVNGNNKIARTLIESAQKDFDKNGVENSLHRLVENGKLNQAKQLLSLGFDAELISDRGFRSLQIAVMREDKAMVAMLVDAGANVDAATNNSPTPLFHSRNDEITLLLLKAGANPNIAYHRDYPLLNQSIYFGYKEKTRLLLRWGANVKAISAGNISPLLTLLVNNASMHSLIPELIYYGADIEERKPLSGETPLMIACYNQVPIEGLIHLIDAGADFSARNSRGLTALDSATLNGNRGAIELLSKRKID